MATATDDLPVGIHSSDLVKILADEGQPVPIWRLRHAASQGHIPSPFKATAGDHLWTADALPAIRRYFENPNGPGRPRRKRS